MRYVRLAAVLWLAAALAGCFRSGWPDHRPNAQLPPLPGELAADCRDPGVRAGRPVLVEFARNRVALAECRRVHRDTVTFYEDIRRKAPR